MSASTSVFAFRSDLKFYTRMLFYVVIATYRKQQTHCKSRCLTSNS